MDEVLGGGIAGRGSVLLLTDPMVDKSTFAQQIVSHRSQEGDNVIYLTTNKLPEHIIENMKQRSWKSENISWVDCISHSFKKEPKGKYFLVQSITNASVDEIKGLWLKALNEVSGPSVAVFDSLETIMGNGGKAVSEMIKSIKPVLDSKGISAIYLLTDWGYNPDELKLIKDAVDMKINLGTLEKKALWMNYFSVDSSRIFFKTTITGVNLYVPKVLITGDYHAGKSSTVKALSDRSVSVDRLGTTVALDHGYVEREGMAVDIFGTPGQERFDWLIKILGKDTWGIILVVDSTDPKSFPRAKRILEIISDYKIPTVVFANKQDAKDAMKPEEVGKALGIKAVVGTVATEKKGCINGLKVLFDEIMKS